MLFNLMRYLSSYLFENLINKNRKFLFLICSLLDATALINQTKQKHLGKFVFLADQFFVLKCQLRSGGHIQFFLKIVLNQFQCGSSKLKLGRSNSSMIEIQLNLGKNHLQQQEKCSDKSVNLFQNLLVVFFTERVEIKILLKKK